MFVRPARRSPARESNSSTAKPTPNFFSFVCYVPPPPPPPFPVRLSRPCRPTADDGRRFCGHTNSRAVQSKVIVCVFAANREPRSPVFRRNFLPTPSRANFFPIFSLLISTFLSPSLLACQSNVNPSLRRRSLKERERASERKPSTCLSAREKLVCFAASSSSSSYCSACKL